MSAVTIPNLKTLQDVTAIQVSIVSPETKALAEDYLARIDKAEKQLVKDIKALKEPHQAEIAKIDAATKSWKELLKDRADTIKAAILAYNNKVKAAVAAANAKALEKFEMKVEKAVDKAVTTGKAIPLILPPSLAAAPPKTSEAEGAKITTIKVRKWRLAGAAQTLDPKDLTAEDAIKMQLAIPSRYFYLDTAAITKVIKAGGAIDGIDAYDDETIAVRQEKEA